MEIRAITALPAAGATTAQKPAIERHSQASGHTFAKCLQEGWARSSGQVSPLPPKGLIHVSKIADPTQSTSRPDLLVTLLTPPVNPSATLSLSGTVSRAQSLARGSRLAGIGIRGAARTWRIMDTPAVRRIGNAPRMSYSEAPTVPVTTEAMPIPRLATAMAQEAGARSSPSSGALQVNQPRLAQIFAKHPALAGASLKGGKMPTPVFRASATTAPVGVKDRGMGPIAEHPDNATRHAAPATLSVPEGTTVPTVIRPAAVKAPSSPNLPSFQETKPIPSILAQGPANIEAWMDHQTGGLLQIRVVDSGSMLGLSLMTTSAMAPRLAKAAGDLQDILDRVSRENGERRLRDGDAVSAARRVHDSSQIYPRSVEIHTFASGADQKSVGVSFAV